MFKLRKAESADIDAAIAALSEAFIPDPLMRAFFTDHPDGVRAGVAAFFSILLRARIALAMPATVLEHDGVILGAAMGYDATRPAWPAPLTAEWTRLQAHVPGLAARMAAYERIGDSLEPGEPHYYLGVIGVHSSLQGKGAGKALLDAFRARSASDPKSGGVYLDTANPKSLEFYVKNGFDLRGEGQVGDAHIWCVYRPT